MGTFVQPWMLLGLLGLAIPVIIHLLNRRRVDLVEWGAMQFLELGRRARRRFELTEVLLMAARMLLLGLVALALARPFLPPSAAGGGAAGLGTERRDVVLVLDGSASMGRHGGGELGSPRDRAIAYAKSFVEQLPAGSSVAVLDARDRVRPLVEPASFDKARIVEALGRAPAPRGASDLPAAIGEAFRLLETTTNPARDVLILTDDQRFAWRPGESARWDLLRDLRKRLPVGPRLWALTFEPAPAGAEAADLSVGPLELPRDLLAPGLPATVTATISNAGPGEGRRTVELLVDGRPSPGAVQVVGPLPPGGKTSVTFRPSIVEPGSHVVTLRLAADDGDPLPADDEASRPVEVALAIPVLLVDGEPGLEPLSGETDFLRAALAPADADAVQVKATVVRQEGFAPETLKDARVVVLANVDRLDTRQAAALAEFAAKGGGVLVAPGDRCDADFYDGPLFQQGRGWLPAKLGAMKGDPGRRRAAAHPAPSSFAGPVFAPFGQGEAPPLADADLFAYRVLEPGPSSAVAARLDTGDPWIVERPFGKGRVAVLAGPLDAEGGTLPVNPDFVPLVNELVAHLADASARRVIRPGETMVVALNPPPPADVADLPITLPDGTAARAAIVRGEGKAEARFADTAAAGIYRLALPDPPGGSTYLAVADDGREADPAPLEAAEAEKLTEGWPFALADESAAGTLFAGAAGGRREIWRWLVLAALGGLCVEVFLTRRLVQERGLAEVGG